MSGSVPTDRGQASGGPADAGETRRPRQGRPPSALRQWWLDRSVRTKALWSMCLPLLVVVAIQVGAVVLEQRQSELRDESRETRDLIDATDRMLLDLGLMQASLWRYTLSGDEALLEPYERLAPALRDRARTMDEEVVQHLGGDRTPVTGPVDAIVGPLALLRDAAAGADVSDAEINAATRGVDQAFVDVLDVRSDLHADLDAELADMNHVAGQLSTMLFVGVGVALVLGVVAALLVTRYIVRRIEALTANVDRFTRGERLQPIAFARDEIGHLTYTLDGVGRLLRKSADQLAASRDEALEATRAKDELLSRMSHELRTPLTAIVGFGQLLQMEDIGEDDRESVDHIVTAGHHLLALINEVLDIAKIETGRLALSVEPVGIAELVDEAIAVVRPQAAERDVTVVNDCEPGVSVIADRQRLKQVLLNLLSNAVKYNRHGGRVDVACEAGGENVRTSVTDTGMGISAAGIDRIFKPFDRLDTVSTTIEGTGVGLALSKGLIEAMGGVIGVDSEVGQGSTFWVDLARAYGVAEPSEPAPAPAERRAARAGAAAGAPVLYVEDNLANLRLVERLFRDRPERLEVSIQGRRSLQLARELRPHLILLDLNLPDIDGTEALRLLKADPATADIPVVIISADATPHRIEQLLEQGAAAYLTKPIDVLRLLDVLNTFAVPNGRRVGRK